MVLKKIHTFAHLFGKKNYSSFKKERERILMIIVPVKEGESIDKALKKYKRKFEKTGVVKELRERQKFTKPSIKRRGEILRAIYIQDLQNQKNN